MRVDNVTFVECEVKKMTKEVFLDKHMPVMWQELKESNRKKKLTDVYYRIAGKPKKVETESEE